MSALLCAQDPLSEAIRLARAHRYQAAAAAIAQAVVPEDPKQRIVYYRAKAAIEFGNGDPVASAADMESELTLAPGDLAAATAVAEYHAGEFREKSGDNLAAVRAFQRAVELAPNEEQYQLALGLELLRHHTFDASVKVFEHAASQFPRSERAKVGLGIACYLDGRTASALKILLGAEPHSELAATYLGQIELDRAETPDTTAVQRVCAFSTPHLQALCGGLLLRTEATAQAIVHLNAAARLAPDDAVARCQLGKALDTAHRYEQARTEMEQCVRLDPQSPMGHFRLARIYYRLGLTDLAKKEELLRAETEKNLGAENDRRYDSVRGFVVTPRVETEPPP